MVQSLTYTAFVLILTFSGSWASTKCSSGQEPLINTCTCLKSSEYGNRASLECSLLDVKLFEKASAQTHNNGETFYQLQLRESNLEGIEGFAEHFLPIESLKMDKVQVPAELLPKLLHPLDELVDLMLDDGNIPVLSKDFFLNKPKLEILDLNRAQIQKIDDDAFEHVMNTLTVLRMEGNNFTKIPLAVLKLPNLRNLALQNNNIQKISEEETKFLKQNDIILTLNSFECSCDASKSSFMTYIREKKMDQVECHSPAKLRNMIAHSLETEEFCGRGSSSTVVASISLLTIIFVHV